MSCNPNLAQRQIRNSSTALHWSTHIHSRFCLSVVSVCWPCSHLKCSHSHCLHFGNPVKEKKTISATTVTKYLVYFNVNIFSCLHSKYLLCCCWGRWKCAARLWKANWKCYHNVMSRKYRLSIKTWPLPARRQLCFLFVMHIKKAIKIHRVVENAELPVKKYTKTGESPSSVDPDSRRHYRAFSQVHLRLNMKYYS